ncbi:FimB/Mfa2 family fimbrial subunit [Candidatus Symbiothrix dinenymphae]|uniref:FimB/Mfa2 family fimbrial subunit n=1 Tax=Candidatus Symbiothrix dinenymphae TaxID=467085 RepID=UPI0006BF229D|nr:FimB/Mfa2 family fimbrial subunit [Candidatus Symbiothrix dinenymphae]GAP73298.1 hypothetical protein SAMD00024442_76_3 [Candidatus Symbiothrix dinenymphae]
MMIKLNVCRQAQLLVALLFVMIGIVSCEDVNPALASAEKTQDAQDTQEVTFTVDFPDNGFAPETRAMQTYSDATPLENRVSSICVMLFDTENRYMDTLMVPGSSITSQGYSGERKTFSIKLVKGTYGTIAFWANVDNILPTIRAFMASTYNKSLIQSYMFNQTTSGKVSFNDIPMYGELTNVTVTAAASSGKTVTLYRSVAKISVTVANTPNNQLFKLEKIYVYNTYSKGRVAPYNINAAAASINSGWQRTNTLVPLEYKAGIADDATEFLLFEANNVADADGNLLKDAQRTCLVLKGWFTDTIEHKPEVRLFETFYRIDFKDRQGDNIDIVRNHKYKVNTRYVGWKGANSLFDAFNGIDDRVQYGESTETRAASAAGASGRDKSIHVTIEY